MHVDAISVWAPWAHLLVAGIKRIETRKHELPRDVGLPAVLGVYVPHQGTVRITHEYVRKYGAKIAEAGYNPLDPPADCLLGFVRVAECCSTLGRQLTGRWDGLMTELERSLGDFSFGRHCWVCDRAVRFPEPVPCRHNAKRAKNVFRLRVPAGYEQQVQDVINELTVALPA